MNGTSRLDRAADKAVAEAAADPALTAAIPRRGLRAAGSAGLTGGRRTDGRGTPPRTGNWSPP
jgi:hypothetical protein